MNHILSKYFTTKAFSLYLLLLAICSIQFYNKVLPYQWIAFGICEVFLFYYFVNVFSKNWNNLSEKFFLKKLTITALLIRLIYVFASYYFYIWLNGTPFEFDSADAMGYHGEALWILNLIEADQLSKYWIYIKGNFSDLGYVSYLSVIYYFFGKSVLLVRIIKVFISTYSCLLIYKITKRHFGDSAARLAGISSVLLPNFIYYCGLHLKEVEMTFLLLLFFERAEYLITFNRFTLTTVIVFLVSAASLFFFRTFLGLIAITSFVTVFLTSSNITTNLDLSRKILITLFISVLSIITLRSAIGREIDSLLADNIDNQSKSMQARAQRNDGNKLATYGSSTIFAPVMFIGPLPTLVNIETQKNQMLMNGGYFVRNSFAFFVFVALYLMFKRKIIKKHLLLLLVLIGYLSVLAFSKFAISERFHFPILPFIMILSAFGISETTHSIKKYYIPYLILVFILIIGWNFFKLAGRE